MNKKIFLIAFILIFYIFGNANLNASTDTSKYFYAKKNYITAILHNDKKKQVKYLKRIVQYGKKLNKNITEYKYELYRLDKNSNIIVKPIKKYNSKYTISSVYTRNNTIVINFKKNISKKDIKFIENKTKNGYYDIFDIRGNFKEASPTKLKIKDIKKIRIVQYKKNILRISIYNKYNTKTVYHIEKKKIVITLYPKKYNLKTLYKVKSLQTKKKQKTFVNKNNYNKTIVIDAGHGGKDAGAVGPRNRKEKIVTLNIANYLFNNLKEKGYKVFLTRNKDRYVKLKYRTKIANNKNADIFISIHANAARKNRVKHAKGIETYFLSPARSKRAKRVAALENKGDINSMSYSSKNILLTLLNRGKITASQKIAIDVQSHMLHELRKVYGNKIFDGGVREGPFWVLVGAQMPSILVEVGYISHPLESKRIYNKKYQKRIADGIATGVISYFAKLQN